MLGQIAALARPGHWVKNLFVFAPLVFSMHLFDGPTLWRTAVAFVSFCLCASAGYALNDTVDRRADLLHAAKAQRPVAAGTLSAAAALATAGVLLAAGLLVALLAGWPILAVAASYAALMAAYSLVLKRLVVLDVMAISIGFILRIVAGAASAGVPPSRWMLLTTFFLALFLGFCKRRSECNLEQAAAHRSALEEYDETLLDSLVTITAGLTIIAYSLYTIDPRTVARVGTMDLTLTVPLVVYGVFRYLYLARSGRGDPVALITRDPHIITAVVVWSVSVVAMLYFVQARVFR